MEFRQVCRAQVAYRNSHRLRRLVLFADRHGTNNRTHCFAADVLLSFFAKACSGLSPGPGSRSSTSRLAALRKEAADRKAKRNQLQSELDAMVMNLTTDET